MLAQEPTCGWMATGPQRSKYYRWCGFKALVMAVPRYDQTVVWSWVREHDFSRD